MAWLLEKLAVWRTLGGYDRIGADSGPTIGQPFPGMHSG
jgi:hypothetical protein